MTKFGSCMWQQDLRSDVLLFWNRISRRIPYLTHIGASKSNLLSDDFLLLESLKSTMPMQVSLLITRTFLTLVQQKSVSLLKLGYFPTGKVQNFRFWANKFNVLWKSDKSVKSMEG